MYYSNQEKFNSQGRKKQPVIFIFLKFILLILIIAFLFIFFVRSFILYPMKINHFGMEPTIHRGDTVFILYKGLFTAKRNDIVLVKNLQNQNPFLCRIVGIEGERISMKNGEVFINSKEVNLNVTNNTSVRNIEEKYSSRDNMSLRDIRPNTFFCLNDNFSSMNDSRMWGDFQYTNILGKVLFKNYIGAGL